MKRKKKLFLPSYKKFANDYLARKVPWSHYPGHPITKLFDDSDKEQIERIKKRSNLNLFSEEDEDREDIKRYSEYLIDQHSLNSLESLNLKPETEDKIQIALFNFLSYIRRAKKQRLLKETQNKYEQREEVIKHLDSIIKSLESLNAPSLRIHDHISQLLSIKMRDWRFIKELKDELAWLKERQNSINEEEYNPTKEIELTNIESEENMFYMTCEMYNDFDMRNLSELDEKKKKFLDTHYVRGQGRPGGFVFKSLQVVIYNLLHEEACIPITEAYKHTADIINEAYKKKGINLTERGIYDKKGKWKKNCTYEDGTYEEFEVEEFVKIPGIPYEVKQFIKDSNYHSLTKKIIEKTILEK